MKMRTFIGLCAALAFAAGSTTVHALKIVDTADEDPAVAGRASNTYAKETLLSDETTDASDATDTTKYYNIAETMLFLSAPADITANAGDTYVVSYTLDGMVFQTLVMNSDLSGAIGGDGFTIAAGGVVGDKSVVFRLSSGASIPTTTTSLALEAQYAISAAGSGSVTRTVTNQSIAGLNLPGISGSMTHVGSGVIKLGSGLKETAMAMDQTATVEHSFRSFDGAATATVGSLQVTFNGDVRRSQDIGGADVDMLSQIIDHSGEGAAAMSTVSIMGDFSFATKAFLHGDNDCGANPNVANNVDSMPAADETDILTREGTGDDQMVTGAAEQNVTAFATMQYLCIMVDTTEDGMRIPDTVAYAAMGDYATIEDGAFNPEPMKQTLGLIMRDGTTVRFPFLTSQARYNQVLRITNRGSNARYEFSSSEMDEPMEDTLMGGGMTTRLLVRDLIGDGVGEASGTLIIEAQPSTIDVALVHVNRDDSSTDTWIYQ